MNLTRMPTRSTKTISIGSSRTLFSAIVERHSADGLTRDELRAWFISYAIAAICMCAAFDSRRPPGSDPVMCAFPRVLMDRIESPPHATSFAPTTSISSALASLAYIADRVRLAGPKAVRSRLEDTALVIIDLHGLLY
jgi:hypothetical protein